MNTNAETALVYNDNSINENMHASVAWRLLQQPQNNFLEHLPEEQQKFVRRTLIQIILATDMAGHSVLLKVDFKISILPCIVLCEIHGHPHKLLGLPQVNIVQTSF